MRRKKPARKRAQPTRKRVKRKAKKRMATTTTETKKEEPQKKAKAEVQPVDLTAQNMTVAGQPGGGPASTPGMSNDGTQSWAKDALNPAPLVPNQATASGPGSTQMCQPGMSYF